MEKEIWKSIPLFEGFYEGSSHGRIRSLDRLVWNGVTWFSISGKILKPSLDRDGYYHVRLSKDGVKSNKKVHRITAFLFCENNNPEINNIVNHLDCNKLNNYYKNLSWTTVEGNTQHAKENGRMKDNGKNLIHNNIKCRKPLYQIGLDGEIISEWSHYGAVPKNIISPKAVWRSLNGKTKNNMGKGFIWKYK